MHCPQVIHPLLISNKWNVISMGPSNDRMYCTMSTLSPVLGTYMYMYFAFELLPSKKVKQVAGTGNKKHKNGLHVSGLEFYYCRGKATFPLVGKCTSTRISEYLWEHRAYRGHGLCGLCEIPCLEHVGKLPFCLGSLHSLCFVVFKKNILIGKHELWIYMCMYYKMEVGFSLLSTILKNIQYLGNNIWF